MYGVEEYIQYSNTSPKIEHSKCVPHRMCPILIGVKKITLRIFMRLLFLSVFILAWYYAFFSMSYYVRGAFKYKWKLVDSINSAVRIFAPNM